MKAKIRRILIILPLLFLAAGSSHIPCSAARISSKKLSRLIWFGDSRTVNFGQAVYGYSPQKGVDPYTIIKKHVVARSRSRLEWASGEGYRHLKKRLKKRPNSIIIFNFGVNDIGKGLKHEAGYLKLIKKIHKKFPRAKLYFMSINPVKADLRNSYAKTEQEALLMNRRIKAFNQYIRKNLPKGCRYINTSKHVKFRYKDGLHYTARTSRRIAYYITGRKKLK